MKSRPAREALRRIVLQDSGQDLLEYGLLMALIAVTAITGVKAVGGIINNVFWEVIGNFR